MSFSLAGAQSVPLRPKFDAFDVATIKLAPADEMGRYFRMDGKKRWIANNFTLKLLVGLAYDLNPKTIEGGPAWIEATKFDIEAVTPGDVPPNRAEQMRMLRSLLKERFALTFHRTAKEFSIYELDVAKGGLKNLKPSAAGDDAPSSVIGVVHPPARIELPARNATMEDFTAMLQRAVLDRPVVDKTGLTGRYDFDLNWAPDESQFAGDLPAAGADAPSPPLVTAVQEQLGLKLTPTRGLVQELVIDSVSQPTSN